MIYAILFPLLGTFVGTLLGAMLGMFTNKLNKNITGFFVNFSIGSLIALAFIELFPEAIENMETGVQNHFLSALYVCLVVFGVGLLFFLSHELLHLFTHHHEEDHDDDETCHDHLHSAEILEHDSNKLFASFVFLLAITIHNIPEGLALGISFTNLQNSVPITGILISIVMMIHNIVIGFSLFTSFRKNNKSILFSLSLTLLSSLTSYACALIGYFVSTLALNEISLGILYAISVGSIIFVLSIELLPSAIKEYKSKFSFLYILLGIVIFVILLAIGE